MVAKDSQGECGKTTGEATLTLFTDPQTLSPYGRAVLYAIELTGQQYRVCFVDVAKGEHKSDEYKAINPTQQVPALRDGDVYLFESAAIIRYLSAKYLPSLEGQCPSAAHYGTTQAVIEYVRSNVFQVAVKVAYHGFVGPKFFGKEVDVAALEEEKEKLAKGLEFISTYFFRHSPKFLVGTHVTTADVLLAIAVKQMDLVSGALDLGAFPKVFDALQAAADTHAFACAHRIYNASVKALVPDADADADAETADLAVAGEAPTADEPEKAL